jgi:hypothetical protein
MTTVVIPLVILASLVVIVLGAKKDYEEAMRKKADRLEKITALKREAASKLSTVSDPKLRAWLASLLDSLESK